MGLILKLPNLSISVLFPIIKSHRVVLVEVIDVIKIIRFQTLSLLASKLITIFDRCYLLLQSFDLSILLVYGRFQPVD